ncbi:MAG: HAD family hydrolase [Deltaproteobacteria bacterium]|nr:MAG: HAD family hydrolase [Deltaproteobacteria bacterium]
MTNPISLPADLSTILLDRDGTLIRECHYLADPAKVELIPGVAAPMRRLCRQGIQFFLVTNQSGIGRGYFSLDEYRAVQQRLQTLLAEEGITLAGEAFCPHAPHVGCACRKPGIGMWETLRSRHALDARHCVMIGDKRADIGFGHHASLCTILVLTGHGNNEAQALNLPDLKKDILHLPSLSPPAPHILAKDLGTALTWIEQQLHIKE